MRNYDVHVTLTGSVWCRFLHRRRMIEKEKRKKWEREAFASSQQFYPMGNVKDTSERWSDDFFNAHHKFETHRLLLLHQQQSLSRLPTCTEDQLILLGPLIYCLESVRVLSQK